jgi:hypothetical protein
LAQHFGLLNLVDHCDLPSFSAKTSTRSVVVKIVNNRSIWMNHIAIHASFDKHNAIIDFVGYCYSDRIFAIVLQVAECDLLHAVKMDRYENDCVFIEYFVAIIVKIIGGMV